MNASYILTREEKEKYDTDSNIFSIVKTLHFLVIIYLTHGIKQQQN